MEMMQSPWMRVMLEEIERKRREVAESREEAARRLPRSAAPSKTSPSTSR
jgi:hypothetical protein